MSLTQPSSVVSSLTEPAANSLTRFARLTPPGSAAIATLAVFGPNAWDYVRSLLSPPVEALPKPDRLLIRHLGDGTLADEVVLAVRSREHVEIHCHGGTEVVRLIAELLRERGAGEVTWRDWFTAASEDPWRAAATRVLAECTTPRCAGIVLDQVHAVGSALGHLRSLLARRNLPEAQASLADWMLHENVGMHLIEPWRIAILGAPNVGKSSLVNALAGYERAIVAPTAGTTRDAVAIRLAVDGWPVEIIDTAGLRATESPLEVVGIERALQAAESADLCLWILDVSTAPQYPDRPAPRMRLVANKCDLPQAWPVERDIPIVSARTGSGIAELLTLMSGWLVRQPPPRGAIVPFTPSLRTLLHGIDELLRYERWDEALQLFDAARPTVEA